jgi:serine O-acetyltransferase
MNLQVESNQIRELVRRQLGNLFVYNPSEDENALESAFDAALRRCEKCFAAIKNKYYQRNGHPYFSPFHSGQYSIFLYFLSNSVWLQNPEHQSLADRIYYLNKALNGLDIHYEVEMPEIFFLDHPVGSVVGRANYKNYFSFSQNCTVGNNKGIYPQFGENVSLMSGAKVLGNCIVSDHVIISANCYVKDQNISSYSIVFGISPHLVIKHKDRRYFLDMMESRFLAPLDFA